MLADHKLLHLDSIVVHGVCVETQGNQKRPRDEDASGSDSGRTRTYNFIRTPVLLG